MLYLASQSPRRKKIFELLGCPFEIVHPDGVVESKTVTVSIEKTVMDNALAKVNKCAENITGHIIIGADTEVFLDGRIFGKPADESGAFEMIRTLSGKTHRVLTGVAVQDSKFLKESFTFFDESQVTFHPLNDKEIEKYILQTQVLDKAGAYAVQSSPLKVVKNVFGSLWNVIGFPVEKFQEVISEKPYRNLFHFPGICDPLKVY